MCVSARRGIIAPPRLIIRREDRIRCRLRFPPYRKRDDSIYRFATWQPSYTGYRLHRRFPRFLSKLIIAEQTCDAAWKCEQASE